MTPPLPPQPRDLAHMTARLLALQEVERKRGLRLILETQGAMSLAKVRAKARAMLGPRCRVEPLFRGRKDPSLKSFFLATVPGLATRMAEPHLFDMAYRVREADADFRSVEPDMPSAAYQPRPEDFGVSRSSSGSLDCSADGEPPADHLWSLKNVRAIQAWELEPPPGGRRFGEGISVGHPDTGYAEHNDLDPAALDLTRGYDFVDDDDDPTDPLESGWLEQPGHGTATGSVIVSRQGGLISGTAPLATLVPIRATRSVVLVFNGSDVARAIVHAADSGCQVISMSLGGVARRSLEAAVNYAAARDVIVLAAAGNCVGFVTAPAVYRNCIAVAGTNIGDQPWVGSSSGPAVNISAPGEYVWCARREPDDPQVAHVAPGEGTSFAVATVAGLAALWLAHHGRQALVDRYAEGQTLQRVFTRLLAETARRPEGWDSDNYGAGIADGEALLRADLPVSEADAVAERGAAPVSAGYLGLFEDLLGPEEAQRQAGELFGQPPLNREAAAARFEAFGVEVLDTLIRKGAGRPELGLARAAAAAPVREGRAGRIRDLVAARASFRLRRAMEPR